MRKYEASRVMVVHGAFKGERTLLTVTRLSGLCVYLIAILFLGSCSQSAGRITPQADSVGLQSATVIAPESSQTTSDRETPEIMPVVTATQLSGAEPQLTETSLSGISFTQSIVLGLGVERLDGCITEARDQIWYTSYP